MLDKSPAAPMTPSARPLDSVAIVVTVVLCVSWGVNQVAVKLAIPEIPRSSRRRCDRPVRR